MSEPTTVVIMTRAPRPGAVKTRLEPLLGAAGCARLQHALILHTAMTARLATPGAVHVAVDPPNAVADLRALLDPADTVFAQVPGHLGARMAAAADRAYAARPGPLVVIGTDVPTLTAARILDARRLLDAGHDVVIGPALDGGYYLIALARPTPEMFDIDPDRWGGPLVLAATITAAEAAGLRVGLLPALRDLDTPKDAHALRADPAMPAAITALLSPGGVTP
jgi:rSAM/selenodomain-associated transferase 1